MSAKRDTLQRQIILAAINSLDTHPSAEDLYLEIQKQHSVIGKSTVYRNLRQMADEGAILHFAVDGVSRYDRNSIAHQHFVCETCGGVFDVEIKCDCGIADGLESKYGYQLNKQTVLFYGTCKGCTN